MMNNEPNRQINAQGGGYGPPGGFGGPPPGGFGGPPPGAPPGGFGPPPGAPPGGFGAPPAGPPPGGGFGAPPPAGGPPAGGFGSPPPAGGPAPYGAPPGPSAAGPKKNSTLAVVSLVTGILAVLPCCNLYIMWLVAIITGFMAKSEIKKNPNLTGDGMATGGIVLGALGFLIIIGLTILQLATGVLSTLMH